MALSTYPAVSSPVKSVQRGSAAGAGTVTITAVDIAKSMVHIFGTTSSGTVSASFTMGMNAGSATLAGGASYMPNFGESWIPPGASTEYSTPSGARNNFTWTKSATVNAGNASVGAGSNNLVAAVVQGYLSNSTSLVVSGACRYEVVEFN